MHAPASIRKQSTSCGVRARVQALQDVHWAFSQPVHSFYPRAYNLSLEADFQQFEADFKWTAAAAVLRVLLRDGGFHPLRVPSAEVAQTALTVCHARLAHLRRAAAVFAPASCCILWQYCLAAVGIPPAARGCQPTRLRLLPTILQHRHCINHTPICLCAGTWWRLTLTLAAALRCPVCLTSSGNCCWTAPHSAWPQA